MSYSFSKRNEPKYSRKLKQKSRSRGLGAGHKKAHMKSEKVSGPSDFKKKKDFDTAASISKKTAKASKKRAKAAKKTAKASKKRAGASKKVAGSIKKKVASAPRTATRPGGVAGGFGRA